MLARCREQRHAARDLDLLRHPVPGRPHRVQPLDGRHPRPRSSGHRLPHRVQPGGEPGDVVVGRDAERVADHADAVEHLRDRRGLQAEHARARVHGAHRVRHPPVGHRAHLAQVLRQHQVRREVGEQRGVQPIQRGAVVARGRGDLPAGPVGGDRARRHHRHGRDLGRPVALVRPADEVGGPAERRDDVGGRGKQRDDAHRAQRTAVALTFS